MTDHPIDPATFNDARQVLALFTDGPWTLEASGPSMQDGPWTVSQAGHPVATVHTHAHADAIMGLRHTLRHLLVTGERALAMLTAAMDQLDDAGRATTLAADPGGVPPLTDEESAQLDDAADRLRRMLGIEPDQP